MLLARLQYSLTAGNMECSGTMLRLQPQSMLRLHLLPAKPWSLRPTANDFGCARVLCHCKSI
jgi:hypothetical protein